MNTLAINVDIRIAAVHVNEERLTLDLMDGRSVSVPLSWYPRLFNATEAQRANWQVAGGGYGIHWPDLDEDLSAEGVLCGVPAPAPTSTATSRSEG
ncbi:MAG: DUF2442 domain-containing protein [Alphaproteobacteria bacterium]|nr:DUF2442 domain-containing protein [Alphaproteobacteria bacterium]